MQKRRIYNFPVIIEKDETGYYVGRVPSLRSCYTQAKTLPELYKNLDEVVSLCLEVEKDFFQDNIQQNEFIGVQNLSFAY